MPATNANWVKRSIRFHILRSDVAVGGPIADIAAKLHFVVGGIEQQ